MSLVQITCYVRETESTDTSKMCQIGEGLQRSKQEPDHEFS